MSEACTHKLPITPPWYTETLHYIILYHPDFPYTFILYLASQTFYKPLFMCLCILVLCPALLFYVFVHCNHSKNFIKESELCGSSRNRKTLQPGIYPGFFRREISNECQVPKHGQRPFEVRSLMCFCFPCLNVTWWDMLVVYI